MIERARVFLCAMCAAAMTVAGCSSGDSEAVARQPDSVGRRDSIAGVAAATMNEGSALGLLAATSIADSSAGAAAATNGSTQELKEFGRTLVREHHALHREADDLGKTLGVGVSSPVVPPDAPGEQLRSRLNQPTGSAWDRAYLMYVVALHESAMENTARALAGTKSPAVRKYIESSVPILQKHLDKARQLLHKSR